MRALADQLQTAIYLSPLTNDKPSFIEGHWYKNSMEMILVIWSNESNREAEATLSVGEDKVLLFDPLGNFYPLQAK